MVQVDILEQLSTLFKIFKANSYVSILSISAIVFLIILLLANKFSDKKITKFIYIFVYALIFGTLIYLFHNEILNLLDYLIDNVFLFLFFPNLAVYILVLIIVNIIVIKSTFSKTDGKIIKNTNAIFFVIFNVIFYLIIDNIIKNKINVYEQLSIYTNNDLLILIELSMKLFILWIILLLIIKISSVLILQLSVRRTINPNLVLAEDNFTHELSNLNPVTSYKEYQVNRFEKSKLNEINELAPPNTKLDKIKDKYNIYNDYLDMVPVKKTISRIDDFKIIDINNQTNNNQKEQLIINNSLETNKFIPDDDTIQSFNNKNEYDYLYFNNINSNMDQVFKFNNNYLNNILNDIEVLKYNQEDKNQIKKIYEDIKVRQKDLTLRDYNYLIDMLLDIKK